MLQRQNPKTRRAAARVHQATGHAISVQPTARRNSDELVTSRGSEFSQNGYATRAAFLAAFAVRHRDRVTDPAPTATQPPGRVSARILIAVGVAAGLAMLPVAHDLAHLPAITGRRWVTAAARADADRRAVRDLAIWWSLFAVVAFALTRAPRRASVVVALALGVVVPVAALAHRAPLSNDLYRYAWDARVQTHAIDPYRYPPDDPHLARLRTRWLWPDAAGCAELGKPTGCLRINRHAVRTIYPPIAEAWFTAVGAVTPAGSEDTAWEAAGLALDLAVTGALLLALRAARADPRLIVFWSACPLVAVEAVQNGHVDALAALFVIPAVALARRGRNIGGAAAGAAAILAKLYPALLLPAVIRGRRLSAAGATALAMIALSYLPHVVAVGPRVLGYLPGYLREEGYTRGTRFLLLNAFGISASAAPAVAAGVLVAVVAVVWRTRPDPALAAGRILVSAFLIATPAQPWYALTLVPLVVLTRRPEWLVVCGAGYPLYLAILVGSHARAWGTASFAVAAGVCLAATVARRRTPKTPLATRPADLDCPRVMADAGSDSFRRLDAPSRWSRWQRAV